MDKISYQDKPVDKWTPNDYADFWRYGVGINLIPADSKKKIPKVAWENDEKIIKYLQEKNIKVELKEKGGWQTNPIPQELHDLWKKEGLFNDGIAVIAGELFRGKYRGMWLNVIDCDNRLAIEILFPEGIHNTAKKTIVEQHANKNKAHVYLLTEKPMEIVSPPFSKDLRDENVVPSIEVKAKGRQIIYCTNSPHKDGSRLSIIDSHSIAIVDADTYNKKIADAIVQYKSQNNNSENHSTFSLDGHHQLAGSSSSSNSSQDFDAYTISFDDMTKDDFFIKGEWF